MKRLIHIILILVMLILPVSGVAHAIVNPDSVAFGSAATQEYGVFNNILQAGDWLITAEGFVNYTVPPTDYTAREAFVFELLNTTGTSVLAGTTISAYGDRPIGFYLTKAQADNLTLVAGTAYMLRIRGNPAIFPSLTGNSANVTLTPADYVDMTGASSTMPIANELRNFMIQIAQNMQAHDGVTTYLTTVAGFYYLTTIGGNLFLAGIPGLDTLCPILFQSSSSTLISGTPTTSVNTGNYSRSLTIENNWGTTTANGLTALGTWLGFSQKTAGAMVYFILVVMFALFFLMPRLQSPIATMFILAVSPFVGTYLGFIAMPIVFDFVIFIVVIAGFIFFSRIM